MIGEATITRRPARTSGGHQREIRNRLRKVGGQLAGVSAMDDNGRPCLDVLDQLSAVAAASDAVALLILEDHIVECVGSATSAGDGADAGPIVVAVRRYVRGHRGR